MSALKGLLPALDLSKKKAEVIDALRELNHPTVVIVDDLDRLPPDEIRTVVQAIKAVADFPKTTYLLAYDRDVVATALGSGNLEAGLSYLEKIVQVAYPLPPLFDYQLRKFVDQQLRHLLSSLGIQLRDYEQSMFPNALEYLTRLSRHPRDVVRLMNRLMLSLPATVNEVNTIDVIVFESLSQRFPKVRECVHRHPTDFTGGHWFLAGSGLDATQFDWTEWSLLDFDRKSDKPRWAKHLPQEGPEQVLASKVCGFLFPEGAGKNERVPEENLHLADHYRLARYFLMTSLDSVPEASDIHEKLANPEAMTQALETSDSSELHLFLEWVCSYLPSSQSIDSEGCAMALVQRARRAHSDAELTAELAEIFAKVLERLVRRAAPVKRVSVFNLIVKEAPLSISEKILLEAAIEQGKWSVHPEMIKDPDRQLISDGDAVDKAIVNWSGLVRQRIDAGSLHEEPRMHSVLYRFAQLNYAYGEVYQAVKKICDSENGLRKFLSTHQSHRLFDSLDLYSLVEDASLLADRIRASIWADEYAWLAAHLIEPERAKAIGEQSAQLKQKDRN